MREYNKMFQTMAAIFDHGEYILRQTARKLEKEFINPLIEADKKQAEPQNIKFDRVARKGRDIHRAIFIRKENINEVVEWLKIHPAVDQAFLGGILSDTVVFTPVAGDITYFATARDYIVEEFDGVDYYIYSRAAEDFYEEFEIIEE